jgi:hypothetical protein
MFTARGSRFKSVALCSIWGASLARLSELEDKIESTAWVLSRPAHLIAISEGTSSQLPNEGWLSVSGADGIMCFLLLSLAILVERDS